MANYQRASERYAVTLKCGLDGAWPAHPTCVEDQCAAISQTADAGKAYAASALAGAGEPAKLQYVA